MTIALLAKERSEAGVRIEARPAQPVDRAVLADERARFAVADKGIIFERSGQSGAIQSVTAC